MSSIRRGVSTDGQRWCEVIAHRTDRERLSTSPQDHAQDVTVTVRVTVTSDDVSRFSWLACSSPIQRQDGTQVT
jgi:hypothetical protein